MGFVYWVTGLSGAGKTTIGRLLYQVIKEKEQHTVFFDGDDLRTVFGDDLGYSREDRLKCAMRYSRLCSLLASQDMNVVCCTISMYDSVRNWNRNNIQGYREIYIKVPMCVLQTRNQKGLYSAAGRENNVSLVGVTYEMEEPQNPDLTLVNDGIISPEEQVKRICEYWNL